MRIPARLQAAIIGFEEKKRTGMIELHYHDGVLVRLGISESIKIDRHEQGSSNPTPAVSPRDEPTHP